MDDRNRTNEKIPGIKCLKATKEDSERAGGQDERHRHPDGHRMAITAPQPPQQGDRREPEAEAGRRERGEEDRVEPERDRGASAKVDEVGHDVGRVGQEDEPDGNERGEQRSQAMCCGKLDGECEHERNRRQEEIPLEEEVLVGSGPGVTEMQQPERSARRSSQGRQEARS